MSAVIRSFVARMWPQRMVVPATHRSSQWTRSASAVVFAALAIWSATDENWSGVIVSIVLGALAVAALLRTRRTSA